MQGVIAAGHPQTAQAGAEILRLGGNAVDAAVAAAFASFVTETALVSIGGGGIAQIYNPATAQTMVYDFFSTMPGLPSNGAAPSSSLDFRKIMVDYGSVQQAFYIGRGSVAVPGDVAGLCQMVAEQGTLNLPQILAPAIRLAQDGIILSDIQAYITGLLTPIFTDTPEMAATYAPEGQMVGANDRLYFTALAESLEQLGQQGPSLFYTGAVSRKILADQRDYGGLLTAADLESYQTYRTAPIFVDYRGYTVCLPPPSSGGGVLIAFALKLLATIPLSDIQHNRFEHLRILAETMRLANVARAEWAVGADPAGIDLMSAADNGVAQLLADETISSYRQKLIRALTDQETMTEAAGPKGPSNTTHISVADANGMVVSVTTSAGESAGFMVADTGIMLNNMLGEIDLHPNGFHQLPPGRRLMTMMSPTLVLYQGQPVLALGSGGSNRLRSAILQVISNVIDFQQPLAQAVDAPRLHFEEDEMQLEGGIAADVADELEAAGYRVNRWPSRAMFFGGVHAVARTNLKESHTSWLAAGDSRRGGAVMTVA